MTKLEYQASFTTPAFLGNAGQQAQWRTPPFKALIRQWWRVVKAPQVRFHVAELRDAEDALFGSASDDGAAKKSHRSLLRLRLSGWDEGKLTSWPVGEPKEKHPEVNFPVGTELYLGFGPLEYDKANRGSALGTSSGQKRTAIDDKAKAELRLMLPVAYEPELHTALQLVAWFGTLGSRSRNGWGSLQMTNEHLKPLTRDNLKSLGVTRTLSECLQEEWPHAIGTDAKGPLVWKSRVTGDWRQVMKELARVKIAFRTQPALSLAGVAAGTFSSRHLLGYPVTNHSVNGLEWGGQGRLANQIRFKLVREGGHLIGVISHLPCCLPASMARQVNMDEAIQLKVWQAVHAVLDANATRLA